MYTSTLFSINFFIFWVRITYCEEVSFVYGCQIPSSYSGVVKMNLNTNSLMKHLIYKKKVFQLSKNMLKKEGLGNRNMVTSEIFVAVPDVLLRNYISTMHCGNCFWKRYVKLHGKLKSENGYIVRWTSNLHDNCFKFY